MAKKASDLSSSEKRQVLEAIRQQIGDSQFEDLRSKHGENALIDMLLQAAEGKSPSQKDEGVDGAKWGCFVGLWVILSIGVALFMNTDAGVVFFFSPLLFLLTFGAPALAGTLAEHMPTVIAWSLVILGIGVVVAIIYTFPPKDVPMNIVIIGFFTCFVVAWVAGVAVRMIRRTTGNR